MHRRKDMEKTRIEELAKNKPEKVKKKDRR
jgi:hypothetical protein